jgi:hypothetical protein
MMRRSENKIYKSAQHSAALMCALSGSPLSLSLILLAPHLSQGLHISKECVCRARTDYDDSPPFSTLFASAAAARSHTHVAFQTARE